MSEVVDNLTGYGEGTGEWLFAVSEQGEAYRVSDKGTIGGAAGDCETHG
ncbi:hypothetical protein [Bacteroides nordii]|nr:hypothetical protein [Bacteroides nordii]